MRTILIKCHKTKAVDMIQNVPDTVASNTVVEAWQREHNGRGCTWKVAETNDLVKCMIEGAKL